MKTMKIKHGGKNVGDSANFISAIKYIREVAYGSPLGSLKEAKFDELVDLVAFIKKYS